MDGFVNADTKKYTNTKHDEEVSFYELLEKKLKVMNGTAIAQCRDNKMPIEVFELMTAGNLKKSVTGEGSIGTRIVS